MYFITLEVYTATNINNVRECTDTSPDSKVEQRLELYKYNQVSRACDKCENWEPNAKLIWQLLSG